MIKVKEAIIVEGKYDKIKLSGIIDGLIIETSGFSVFNDIEKRNYIKMLAEKKGIIILTDSDGAGFLIRNHIKSFVPKDRIKNVYIPEIHGKEPRKQKPSKEGTLGVEGIPQKVIEEAFAKAGITESEGENVNEITKTDLFLLGLSGGDGSRSKRDKLKKVLGLPQKLSANALLDTLRFLMTKEEIEKIITENDI